MKKIISLLLCLMMLIPAAVSTAAGKPITSVSLSVTVPKAGDTTATRPKVTIPSGSNYSISGTFWISDDYIDVLPGNIVFEAGKTYNIGIVLVVAEGYSFQSPAVHVTNGTLATDFEGFGPSSVGNMIAVVVKVTIENVVLSKPKSVKLTAVSAKKIKISWKKLSAKDKKKIQKLEIQVSTSKSFSKIVKKKTVSSGKTSCTFSGLKKNTKYYVRIRAYTKSGDVISTSKWVVKSKKTKKK